MKKVVLVTVLLFSLMLTSCTDQNRAKDKGFKEPEEVIENLVKAINKGDFNKATESFAINLMAENYNLGEWIDHWQVWAHMYDMPYPSEDKSFLQTNKASLKAEAIMQVSNICFSLVAEEEFLQMEIMKFDGGEGAEIAESFKLHDLDKLSLNKMERIELGDPSTYNDTVAGWNKIYGSDDFADYEIVYDWNGSSYKGSATLIQYGELWYIYSLKSNAASGKSTGYLERI